MKPKSFDFKQDNTVWNKIKHIISFLMAFTIHS